MSVATAGWIPLHPYPSSLWWSSFPPSLLRGFCCSSVGSASPGSSGPRRWMPTGVVGDFILVGPYGDYATTTTAASGTLRWIPGGDNVAHQALSGLRLFFPGYANMHSQSFLFDAAQGVFFLRRKTATKSPVIRARNTDEATCESKGVVCVGEVFVVLLLGVFWRLVLFDF